MDIPSYLVSNIPLFAISSVMIFLAFRNLRVRRKESIYFLVFTTIVLFLSVVCALEKYSQRAGLPVVGTIFTAIGYILRPTLLFVFVLLTNMDFRRERWFFWMLGIPLVVNSVLYTLPLFMNVEPINKLVFYYAMNDDGVTASFVRGSFLNFFSHAICLFYLGVVAYVSTVRFHGKHRRDSIVLLICIVFVLATVAAEVVSKRNDLLNIVCEICAAINYIFIMTVNSSKDPLTNLYDRRTYLEDVSRYKNIINGLVVIDMNELKFVNDNYGHQIGDKALSSLAIIFESSIEPSVMCTYRVSGDEFVILMFQGKIGQLDSTVSSIREKMNASEYSAAIGCCYLDKKAGNVSFEEAIQKAEELMYQDKNKHYNETGHTRRQR